MSNPSCLHPFYSYFGNKQYGQVSFPSSLNNQTINFCHCHLSFHSKILLRGKWWSRPPASPDLHRVFLVFCSNLIEAGAMSFPKYLELAIYKWDLISFRPLGPRKTVLGLQPSLDPFCRPSSKRGSFTKPQAWLFLESLVTHLNLPWCRQEDMWCRPWVLWYTWIPGNVGHKGVHDDCHLIDNTKTARKHSRGRDQKYPSTKLAMVFSTSVSCIWTISCFVWLLSFLNLTEYHVGPSLRSNICSVAKTLETALVSCHWSVLMSSVLSWPWHDLASRQHCMVC